jgi:hypothetical protein
MRMASIERPLGAVAEATNCTGELIVAPAAGDVIATPALVVTLTYCELLATCPMEFQALVTTRCDPAPSERYVLTEVTVVLNAGWSST